MNKKVPFLLILRYTIFGTILSILVFFSLSFLDLLFDIDTFNPSANRNSFRIDFGVPFTYYAEEFQGKNTLPSTRFFTLNLLLDCTITWLLIALPYIVYKVRKRLPKKQEEENLIDQ